MEKLKQKVASSSSRVIASLQQAATGNFQQQQPQAASGAEESTSSQQQQPAPALHLQQQQKDNQSPAGGGSTAARMMAADATAHLTEEEREILLEVFRKEEQFQRDTIKQMVAARSVQGQQQLSLRDSNQCGNNQLESGAPSNKENCKHSTTTVQHQAAIHANNNNSCGPQFAPTRSATPISMPPSRASSSSHQQQPHPRASSSCSATSGASTNPDSVPLGQCRICRKFILANETCHLCSACNQFVCEDCGSYSASNQNWTCSSCRRRATKPAISADALKELGLNRENSSAFRRMTLRLNQAELRLAVGQATANNQTGGDQSSSLSNFSSTSVSSCQPTTGGNLASANNDNTDTGSSSASQRSKNCQQLPAGSDQPQHEQIPKTDPPKSGGSTKQPHQISPRSLNENKQNQESIKRQTNRNPAGSSPPKQQQQPKFNVTGPPKAGTNSKHNCDETNSSQPLGSSNFKPAANATNEDTRNGARKSLSQPISRRPANSLTDMVYTQQHDFVGLKSTGDLARIGPLPVCPQAAMKLDQESHLQFVGQQQQQLNRRDSLSNSSEQHKRCGDCATGSVPLAQNRKHSTTYYAQNLPTNLSNFPEQQQAHSMGQQQQQLDQLTQSQQITMILATGHEMMAARQQQQQLELQQKEAAIRRRSSNATSGQQQVSSGVSIKLTPIQPDQIHLRRLSDQSNLVRRSSIITDEMDALSMTRNRSQSNIDTASYVNYFHQSPLMRSERLLQQQQQYYATTNQQNFERANYPFVAHEPLGALNQQSASPSGGYLGQPSQQQTEPWLYQNHYQQQQEVQMQQMLPSLQLSSIVTPYAQKSQRQSSEDMRSDSSSDIEDDLRVGGQTGPDFDNEQPSEHFAPPRALSFSINAYMLSSHPVEQRNYANHQSAQQISIPSVSVSEFGPGQLQQRNLRQQQQQYDQIMTTPMQINSAIEQAIRDQEQQQQQLRTGGNHNNELLIYGDSPLPRRGSGGRTLPKIPGEQQSRSLLDLPFNQKIGANLGDGGDQQFATLDLPGAPIRRASAPEGQNIKIVVDDIDGSMMRGGTGGSVGKQHHRVVYGSKGELYERLVLYRDDSIDPNTNMVRGFGLQVMGGKIDADNKLQACVSWILPGGPADKVGLKPADKIIEWDGKCLINMSYEQVSDVIESSANIAELLVKPNRLIDDTYNTGANYVRSQRRLSQQTERDLKRQQVGAKFDKSAFLQTNGLKLKNGIALTTMKQQMDMYRLAGQQQPNYQIMSQVKQQQQQLAATTITGQTRSGTGRKLPQIPDCKGYENSSGGNLNSKDNFLMTGGAISHQQQTQSLSTGELYPGRGSTTNWSTPQPIGFNNSTLFGQLLHQGKPVGFNTQLNGTNNDYLIRAPQLSGANDSLSTQNEICGLIGLQVSVDDHVGQLEISILSAINIDRNPSLDYCVRVKILPESNRFKPCTTQPSCDLNWKETFIFQNFPTKQIHRMALEIGIWVYEEAPRLSAKIAQPICETLISIQSARERNTDFWPLWPPPSSPQARRKSLNDLIETHSKQDAMFMVNGNQYESNVNRQQQQRQSANWTSSKQFDMYSKVATATNPSRLQVQAYDSPINRFPRDHFSRERSSSARNLPNDVSGTNTPQPRRASDEVTGSSSHRLAARVSPAASRRSISVMNVGDGNSLFTRPSSRLGSQANILKSRRDSSCQQHPSSGDSPKSGRYVSPNGSMSRVNDLQQQQQQQHQSQQQIGETPSGRRSSLVGLQSMRGYTSQKNSHSGPSTDQESPLRTSRRAQSTSNTATAAMAISSGATVMQSGSDNKPRQQQEQPKQAQQHTAASSHSGSSVASANCSRRGSNSELPNQLQRKGSFAMQTLRKLKRTMSFNKGNASENLDTACNKDVSRRSSSSSELDENAGVSSRLATLSGSVGKLKLSFVLTKGQLEVDVICAQGLKFDQESTLGIYVKIYLKLKTKSNKRKTRTVVPSESPVFRQIIKYDGSLVDNKALEVSVWHKKSGLRGKAPIGFTEIQLNELRLEQLQTSWYNLHPMDMVCSSSIDE